MRMLNLALILASVLVMLPSLALAGVCPNPNPEQSPAWRNFEQVVTREYLQPAKRNGTNTGATNALAYGHALGRLASAVQGQPDRETAFDCIDAVLVKAFNYTQITSPEDGDDRSFREEVTNALYLHNLLREASRGMHDDRVAQETGVTSVAPLYGFFGGRIDDQIQQQRRTQNSANSMGALTDGGVIFDRDRAAALAASIGGFGTSSDERSSVSPRLHPCVDPDVPVEAIWTFYSRGYGGGQASYSEKRDMICFSNSYSTFYGAMKHHVCEKGWKNCRLKSTSAFTKIDMTNDYVVYYYDEGKNSGVRTPVK